MTINNISKFWSAHNSFPYSATQVARDILCLYHMDVVVHIELNISFLRIESFTGELKSCQELKKLFLSSVMGSSNHG